MTVRPSQLAAALAVLASSGSALAQSVPASFISDTDCLAASPSCACADAQFMEVYRAQQQKGRDTWVSVGTSFPASPAAALAAFQAGFTNDPRVSNQFATCPGYNPAVNVLTKIAGVRSSGDTAYDPCFCAAFCKDIVQATIDHERTHRPTLLLGFFSSLPAQFACKAASTAQPLCDRADANTLVNSEIVGYQVTLSTLNSAISRIASSPDPNNPQMDCTWTSLVLFAPPPRPPSVIPESFLQRLAMLMTRLWSRNVA